MTPSSSFRRRFTVTAIAVSSLAVFSLEAAKPKASPTPKGASSPTPSGSPAAADYVLPDPVARLDGQDISRADLERLTNALLSSDNRSVSSLTAVEKKQVYASVLRNMITDRLVSEKAASETVSDMDIEKRLDELRKMYPDETAMDAEIKRTGQTIEQVRRNIRNQLAREQWITKQTADQVVVTPEEVEKFYKDGPPDKFDQPEKVSASHILIAVRKDAPPEEILLAEKKANDLEDRLKKGEKFDDLARQYSDAPTAKKTGGDIGSFARAGIMPEFGDAAFKLKDGEISPPVRTQFGYHIIEVTGHTPAHTVSLDDARPQIMQYLRQQKEQAAASKLVQDLVTQAKLEVFLPQ